MSIARLVTSFLTMGIVSPFTPMQRAEQRRQRQRRLRPTPNGRI